MKNEIINPQTGKNSEDIDAAELNKTDRNGAYVDKDGRSKNYKNGKASVNGPNWDKLSKNADGDTGQNAGVFK